MSKLDTLNAALTVAINALTDRYPHHCGSCRGRGGFPIFEMGSYWEPPSHDFSPCFDCEGRNPLDTRSPMSEEEAAEFDRALPPPEVLAVEEAEGAVEAEAEAEAEEERLRDEAEYEAWRASRLEGEEAEAAWEAERAGEGWED